MTAISMTAAILLGIQSKQLSQTDLPLRQTFAILGSTNLLDDKFRFQFQRDAKSVHVSLRNLDPKSVAWLAKLYISKNASESKCEFSIPFSSLEPSKSDKPAVMASALNWLIRVSYPSFSAEGSVTKINDSEWLVQLVWLPKMPSAYTTLVATKSGDNYTIRRTKHATLELSSEVSKSKRIQLIDQSLQCVGQTTD